MRNGHAIRDEHWNARIDVEPRIFKECSFSSAHAHIGNRRVAAIVISIETENGPGDSFRSQAHTWRTFARGGCSQRGIAENHREAVGRNCAGIAERHRKAELDVASGNQIRPDQYADLVVRCGC